VRIKESSGHRILDQAAMSSVRKWVFEPGRRNGLRIAMTVLVPVRFTLQ
jgi:protein TonB